MRTPILLAAIFAAAACSHAPTADLAGAVDRTLAAGSGLADITITVAAPGGRPVVARGDGGFDAGHGRRWLRLDLGPLVAAAGGAPEGAELARAGTVVDGDHVYVLRPGGRWAHVEAPGAGVGEPFASSGPDAILGAVGRARDGRLSLPAGALPGVPAAGDAVPFEVELDGERRVRRVLLRPELPAGSVSVSIELHHLGEPVTVPVPARRLVTDVLLG